MKNDILHIISNTRYRRMVIILLTVSAFIFNDIVAVAQGAKDSSSKLSFTLNLGSVLSNGTRSISVRVSRKENKKTIKVDDLKSPVNIYLNEVKDHDPVSGSGWISKLYLNQDGEGIFDLPGWFDKLTGALHEFTFIAKTTGDPKYEDAEEQITVHDAKISLVYSGEDSVKTLAATISGWKDSAYVPVPNAELKLCIKRTFNFLLFGELGAVTNEQGEISGELPPDVPGNANNTLTIGARLEDDENYGTVEVTTNVKWDVLPKVNPVRGRTLWSPGDNAPLVLVISSVIIIVVIWGTVIYLVYLLFKIKRLSRSP